MSLLAGEATRRIRRHRGDGGRAREILPRDAVQVAWALGTMDLDNVSMGDALARLVDAVNGHWIKGCEGQRPLAWWTHANLVQMATTLAHSRLDSRLVLLAVYGVSLRRLRGDAADGRGFSAREVSVLVWVQARLYLTPSLGDVYGAFPDVASCALLRQAEGGGRASNPRERANLAWSVVVLGDYSDAVAGLLRVVFRAASQRRWRRDAA